MKEIKKLVLLLVIGSVIGFTACTGDDDDDDIEPSKPYETGVFIANEGAFQTGTGTISFLDRTKKTITNDIFNTVNSRPLGNILSDIEIYNDKAYMVVNNAEKVEVVDFKEFKSAGVINGLTLPFKFQSINNNKAYVSQWGAMGVNGSIEVIDLTTNTITTSIATGKGASSMLKIGDKVYVANKGGYAYDSNVTVINSSTDKVESQIYVGYNPNSLQVDKNGMIWALCGGKWKSDFSGLEHTGRLVKIDPSDNTIKVAIDFTSMFSTPSHLTINKDKSVLYFIYQNSVYSLDVSATNDASQVLIAKNFYSIGYDPVENLIYGGDAKDFVGNGVIFRYDVAGTLVDSFSTGVIPTDYYFN